MAWLLRSSWRSRIALLGLAIIGVTTLIALPGLGAGATSTPTNNRTANSQRAASAEQSRSLVYTLDEGRNLEIVAAANGAQVELSRSASDDFDPAWSKDGTRLAFVSNRGGDYDIYVMDADGNNVRQVTDAPGLDTNPTWSPDGKQITYVHETSASLEIFTISAEGGTPLQLTNNDVVDIQPDWSPDGQSIAFTSNVKGDQWAILAMSPSGGDVTILISGEMYASSPAWSSDGSTLAYLSDPDQRDQPELRLLTPSSGEDVTLLLARAPLASLDWAPDGSGVVFLKKTVVPYHLPKGASIPEAGLWRLMFASANGETETLVDEAPLMPGVSW